MTFGKAQGIQGDFTSHPDFSTRSIFTKVIIIDKRNQHISPQIFSMSPETTIDMSHLQALKLYFISGFHEESFIPMGTMRSIDRKKKILTMTDGKLLSYEHLIVVANSKNDSKDDVNQFFIGLATLVDALRMQKQSQVLFERYLTQIKPQALNKKSVHLSPEKDSISRSAFGDDKAASDWLHTDIHLYEVQI